MVGFVLSNQLPVHGSAGTLCIIICVLTLLKSVFFRIKYRTKRACFALPKGLNPDM